MKAVIGISSFIILISPALLTTLLYDKYIKLLFNKHHDLWLNLGSPCGTIWDPPNTNSWQARAAHTKMMVATLTGQHRAPLNDAVAIGLLLRFKILAICSLACYLTLIGSGIILFIYACIFGISL